MDVVLVNVLVGVAIVDALEYAMRFKLIAPMYTFQVVMIAMIGMCVVSIIGAGLDRSDR